MAKNKLLDNLKLQVSVDPPYDPLQAFVRENHIALKGVENGELQGLTFGAKDVFKILGSTYGNGHPKWLQTNSPDDFTTGVIDKLLEHGADLVGKTVCDELCFSISGENWHYGSPINPHDPRRFAGGSSSGSGVAVAGGLVDFALGSDCLGSVRVPASYNGIFGMRPTYARVDNEGEAPYCESMDVLGYMARETEVLRKVSKIILGRDEQDYEFSRLIVPKDCYQILDLETKLALKSAVDHIKSNFSFIDEGDISIQGLEEWVDVFRYIQGYEVWESYGSWIRKYRPFISRGAKERLKWASTVTLGEYKKAYEKKRYIINKVDERLGNDGVICIPTVASIAPLRTTSFNEINKIREKSSVLLAISPLTGTPQITIPMANKEGMPLGVSLIGPRGSDLALVQLSTYLFSTWLDKNRK